TKTFVGGTPRRNLRAGNVVSIWIEQDHRRIKRRTQLMFGFKSMASAGIILSGTEMLHMMRKRQARSPTNYIRRSPRISKTSPPTLAHKVRLVTTSRIATEPSK